MTRTQHSPFSIQVELVEGCSMACTFCGINGIREKPGNYKFASLDLLKKVASDIRRLKWDARIEFAMHGEPSLHPKVVQCIRTFRNRLPSASLMMTSNASGFIGSRSELIPKLFDAGLNVLALDDYADVTYVERVEKWLRDEAPDIPIRNYPEDRSASIHKKRPTTHKEVVIAADIASTSEGNHGKVMFCNHAGQAAPPSDSKADKRCAYPFREMSIRWNGDVGLCCDDFRGTYRVGSVADTPMEDIWQHPRFESARRKLYHGQRDFGACKGCDSVTYRTGLLPDPTGQETMPKPNRRDDRIIAEALEDGPCTEPVLRTWEIGN